MIGRLVRRALNRVARAGWFLWFLVGCGGPAFEQASPAGAELAGSPSVAGSLSAGGSGLPEREATASGTGGAAGDGGAELVLGGAAGDASLPPPHPCDVSAWTAQAFASREAETSPAAALDGSPETRWTSGQAQAAGQWFALELGAGVVLEQLALSAAEPGDVPSLLRLELDGEAVDARATASDGALALAFVARPASSARLVLATSAPSWWSIGELQAVCR